MISFDIALVAQKVKVVNEDWCALKKWGGGCMTNRTGWLLELLTELLKYQGHLCANPLRLCFGMTVDMGVGVIHSIFDSILLYPRFDSK